MNIIIISPSKVFGGGEKFLFHLIESIEYQNITLVAKNSYLIKNFEKNDKVGCIKKSIFLYILRTFIINIFKKTPILLILNGLGENRLSGFLSKIFRIRYIVICHSIEDWGGGYDLSFKHKVRTFINKFCFRNANKIVSVCTPALNNLSLNFSKDLLVLIPNTAGKSYEYPLEITKNNSLVTFGFMGRLSSEKGIDIFCRLVEFVYSNPLMMMQKVSFIIAGDGPEKDKIISLQEKFPNLVKYIGFVDSDIFFHKIDALIMTSRSEAMPLVALEAMRLGRCVISTNVGGIQDLIVDGINGYKFSLSEMDVFAQKIFFLAERKEQLISMNMQSFSFYSQNFDFNKFRKKYNEII